jgi:hypothetical protein
VHGPLLAYDLAGAACPSWGTGPWHDAGVHAPGALAAQSPRSVRRCDDAVVLRRLAGGKVFPLSMTGAQGWCQATRGEVGLT